MTTKKLNRGSAAVFLTAIAAIVVLMPGLARAEEASPGRQLREITSRLVPYDMDGTTLEAIAELEGLQDSLNPRVAATARFLRVAAAVDLLSYAELTSNAQIRSALAEAFSTNPEALPGVIQEAVDGVNSGTFRQQAQGYGVVLRCLSAPGDSCAIDLRRVANSTSGAATAARLLLLEPLLAAVEAARRAPPSCAERNLAEAGASLCQAPATDELRSACEQANAENGDSRRLARAVFDQTLSDITALERAGRGNDPLVSLVRAWVDSARERAGWLVFAEPLQSTAVGSLNLPSATSEPTQPPLELLIVDSSRTVIALSPMTALQSSGSARMDEAAELSLPGRTILSGPYGFRALVRPIDSVTTALEEMRSTVDEILAAQAGDGPQWIACEHRPLGLLIDRDMMLADVARFVMSARRAGYQRFVLFGRRADGQLAALPATIGSASDSPQAGVPRLAISPRDIRFTREEGAAVEFSRRDPNVGQTVAGMLNGHNPSFSVQATQAWMSYGLVFPTIDAVMAASTNNVQQCMFILPD